MEAAVRFLIAGRPNSGKSTLFNILAGANQKVGNYSGCTVEKKMASLNWGGKEINLTDLPGLYSLKANSVDEGVALEEIENATDCSHVLVVVDGNNIRQELSLPLLLKERGYSVLVAVNMMDEVEANKTILNLVGMTELAGIPFFGISAKTGEGVNTLKSYLEQLEPNREKARGGLSQLENQDLKSMIHRAAREAKAIAASNVTMSDSRALDRRNETIDAVLTHRVAGPAIFLVTMFLVFQSVFAWASPMTDAIDGFFGWAAGAAQEFIPYPLLTSLVGDGLIAGVGAVLVFVPQIFILFTMIALLELSGYLPRAAYMIDRLMKPWGLDGKVVIPLLSSVACAVPGIMSARSIENPRTRLVTVMIAPLMTCSARLPVYTLLIAAFIPATTIWGLNLQGMVMGGLFMLGVAMALVVALILKWTGKEKDGCAVDFIHLPNYRIPEFKMLVRYVSSRVMMFVKKVGKIIAAMTIILWALLTFPQDKTFEMAVEQQIVGVNADVSLTADAKKTAIVNLENSVAAHAIENSYGGRLGKLMEPLFAPIGYDWKLSIGLLASLAAREVFVATMGTVFALGEVDEDSTSMVEKLRLAKRPDGSPAYTIATCLSLLVFFAFSLQCISTIAVAKRETNGWKIPILMFVYMFGLAYGGAFVVYQLGTQFFG